MISIEKFISMAASFPEATIQPHFEKRSFRAGNKIFATLDEPKQIACVKLSLADQDVFCAYDKTIIYPVPNKWGKQGSTFINLQTVDEPMLYAALQTAYCAVAPAKLVALFQANNAGDADLL